MSGRLAGWVETRRQRLQDARQSARHTHGWEVPLVCDRCGHQGLPTFTGWTSRRDIRFGTRPTVFANLHCPRCKADLTRVAGQQLVALFGDVRLGAANRRLIVIAVGLGLVLPALLLVGFALWGWPAWIVGLLFALVGALMQWMGLAPSFWQRRCECGNPQHKFMGMLGRSCCYRCSSCGRLKRVLT